MTIKLPIFIILYNLKHKRGHINMYRLNNFHYLVKNKPKNILYNTLTGSLMWVNDEFAKAYFQLCQNNIITDELLLKLFKDPQVVNKLKDESIVIKKDFDELSFVRKYQTDMILKNNSTNVEFIVTYNCNLNCTYCYAIRKKVSMTPEIAYKAANFAIDLAKSRQSKDMMIQFIGGEPLLNQKAIEIIVEQIHKFKQQNKIKMATTLTTNGLLLNEQVIKTISKLGPIQVQVTVDGPENIHNERRISRGRNPYQMIMDNLIKFKEIIDELVIRINIDRENIRYCPTLLQDLADNNLVNASLSIVPTFSHTENCSHYQPYCFTEQEMILELEQLWNKAIDVGFNVSWNPLPSFMSCGSLLSGSIAIDPYGDIYKCAATYGDKQYVVGDIFKGLDSSPDSLNLSYMKRDSLVLEDKNCMQCASLPICMGGCSFRAKRKTGSINSPDCRYDKSICLESFVRLYANWYKKNNFEYAPKFAL